MTCWLPMSLEGSSAGSTPGGKVADFGIRDSVGLALSPVRHHRWRVKVYCANERLASHQEMSCRSRGSTSRLCMFETTTG